MPRSGRGIEQMPIDNAFTGVAASSRGRLRRSSSSMAFLPASLAESAETVMPKQFTPRLMVASPCDTSTYDTGVA